MTLFWERASALETPSEGFGLPLKPRRALPFLFFEQAKKGKDKGRFGATLSWFEIEDFAKVLKSPGQ
ncbi:MAG TPA: hypothetical protein EYP53_08325 [Candidatus Latescibacteria bacterium]|nr:hypothetical protein [Candidatus Latescibacterota bacterium]